MVDLKNMNKETIINTLKNIPFDLRTSIDLPSTNTFGIEIEFELAYLDSIKNIDKWKLKEETIVSKKQNNRIIGGELISPVLIDTPESWLDISTKCHKLVKKGAVISNCTGGHIHIGSQILGENPDNIRRLLKQWELFENLIYYFSYGYSRSPRSGLGIYANPIGKKLKLVRTSVKGYTNFKTYYHWLNYFKKNANRKNQGINFQKYRGCEEDLGNTIEIRCPNGSLNPAIWQNNINFFTKFLLSCHENNCDEEFIDYLLRIKDENEYGIENFEILQFDKAILLSDMVYDKEIDKLLFLKQYLKLFTEEEKNKNYSV